MDEPPSERHSFYPLVPCGDGSIINKNAEALTEIRQKANEDVIMKHDHLIRELRQDEIEKALSLVWKVFQKYEVPDYTKEGTEEFYKSIHDESYLSELCCYGAFIHDELVGVIATRNSGSHIALFFADGKISQARYRKTAVPNRAKSERFRQNNSEFIAVCRSCIS